MTTKDFKMWLIKNDHTQKSLAAKFNCSENTICNYCKNNHFPFTFVLALVALERGLSVEDLKI